MSPRNKRPGFSLVAGAALCGLAGFAGSAQAGGFGVHEQSATYLGSAFAGSAAGGDISSIFWNSAATGITPGCNAASSYTGIFASGEETVTGGLLPALSGAARSTDVGTDALVPASYLTCQLSDRLFVGLGLNSPFGLITKPDNTAWVGSALAVTSKIFTVNINPTVAYKVSPTLTVGVGVQIEYFKLRLTSSGLPGVVGARSFEADDWGVGATAGVLWQPAPGTSIGLGYRSAVDVDPSGTYERGPGAAPVPPNAPAQPATNATGSLTLPDQVTLSVRQAVAPKWTLLGTVEWQNWSRLGNVSATGAGCVIPGGLCETLNLNYRDGWFFSVGAEYQFSPVLTLRGGVAYEMSPITDRTRSILLPDSDRVFVSVGASYKYSDNLTLDLGYSHIFFDDASFCMQSPVGTGTTHCTSGGTTLLSGSADGSADLLSVGLRYKF